MDESVLPLKDIKRDQLFHSEQQAASGKREYERIAAPEEFEIEESEIELGEDEEVEYGKEIESWEPLELFEHVKMRALLTYCAVGLWVVWTLSGLIHFLLTGNVFLIVTSPPLAIFLRYIFTYYFRKP